MGTALETLERQRARMVEHHLRARDIRDPLVLDAFARVPREAFVPDEQYVRAYDDVALPIGDGQTISQPYVVAMTIQALALQGGEHVLEIGAGSGYAAAILARIASVVDTVERIPSLAMSATERLLQLGITNVNVHCADGSLGWPSRAPYEAIAVAAGAPRPPRALLQQLAIGGRLVIPHGPHEHQRLARITRVSDDHFEEESLGDVRFVPLIGAQGWAQSQT